MDGKTANRMMVPFLEGALSLEETDHFLKHIKESSGCREDLEIYYTLMHFHFFIYHFVNSFVC